MEGERELTTGLLSMDASFCLLVRGQVGVKEILITDYPQPSNWSTKHEHAAVSAGLSDGAQQGPISEGPQ